MDSVGPMEILVVAAICGACLLPIAIGGIAVVIAVLARQ
jgi:hypothetical protein